MKRFSPFELHLFDLDDTLINTRFSYKNAQEQALLDSFPQNSLEEHQKQLHDLQWLCEQFGSGNLEEYTNAFLKNLNLDKNPPEELALKQIQLYKDHFWKRISLIPGAINFLEFLREQGKQIALVSNGIRELQEIKLKTTGLDRFFSGENIYVSSQFEARYRKPSPHMIRLACTDFKTPPQKTIYYGNMISDIIAGNLGDVHTVFLTNSNPIPNQDKPPQIARPNEIINNWLSLKN